LAEAIEWIPVAASPETLLELIRDRSQRFRFLPHGWRVLRLLTPETDTVGAAMEIEANIGPSATVHVVQVLETGDDFVTEGPPGGDNFVTMWTVQERGRETIVQLEVEFHYGGLVGEYFARRKLRRALKDQLQKLKAIAETR
jgi:hypothetical protein